MYKMNQQFLSCYQLEYKPYKILNKLHYVLNFTKKKKKTFFSLILFVEILSFVPSVNC